MLCLTSPTMKRFHRLRETSKDNLLDRVYPGSSTSTSAFLTCYSRAASDGSGQAEGLPRGSGFRA